MPRKSKRSLAALKGWKTRRRKARQKQRKRRHKPQYGGVEISTGYASHENAYQMTVLINPYKRGLEPKQIASLVERLAAAGHFDDSPNNPVMDLRWASAHNSWYIVRTGVRIGRGKARLVEFTRENPSP